MSRRSAADLRPIVLGELLALAPSLRQLLEGGLERRRLTMPRVRLLFALHETGPAVMSELGRALDVTPRNVTGLVDGLERAGLVRRSAHPTDRRATLIELTAAGRRTCRSLQDGYDRLAADLLGPLGATDLTAAERVLGQVRSALDARRG